MIYANLHTSFLRFCADFAEANPGLVVVNFDAHADESTLPASDIIGLSQMTFTEDEGILSVKALIGIATLTDENNFRLVSLMDKLYELLRPTKRIDVYRAESDPEEKVGWMICQDGTTVLPVSGTTARPLQFIAIHLATSVSFR